MHLSSDIGYLSYDARTKYQNYRLYFFLDVNSSSHNEGKLTVILTRFLIPKPCTTWFGSRAVHEPGAINTGLVCASAGTPAKRDRSFFKKRYVRQTILCLIVNVLKSLFTKNRWEVISIIHFGLSRFWNKAPFWECAFQTIPVFFVSIWILN